MKKCKKCSKRNYFGSPMLGICQTCFKKMNAQAGLQGYTLKSRPSVGEALERKLMGVSIWWWRGSWRASG